MAYTVSLDSEMLAQHFSLSFCHFASRQGCVLLLTQVQGTIQHRFIRSVLHSQFSLEFYGLFQKLPVVM